MKYTQTQTHTLNTNTLSQPAQNIHKWWDMWNKTTFLLFYHIFLLGLLIFVWLASTLVRRLQLRTICFVCVIIIFDKTVHSLCQRSNLSEIRLQLRKLSWVGKLYIQMYTRAIRSINRWRKILNVRTKRLLTEKLCSKYTNTLKCEQIRYALRRFSTV